jgi:hypothetical protein
MYCLDSTVHSIFGLVVARLILAYIVEDDIFITFELLAAHAANVILISEFI